VASRRFRAKSSLNSNLSQVNARVSQITKRPSPRRIAANSITNVSIRNASIASENLSDGSVTSQKLAADAVRTGNIADRSVTSAKLAAGTIPVVANLDASVITTGSFGEARIPNLPASKITSGTFSASVIGDLPASKITSETFDAARIPNLDTSKITSGVFDSARIPAVSVSNLDASVITSGTFSTSRIPSITGSMIAGSTITDANIAANTILQGSIAADAVGPSELREDGSYTMAALNVTGTISASGSIVIYSNGRIGPNMDTSTSTANVRSPSNGSQLLRTGSARRFKLDIQDSNAGLSALQLRPRNWIDKYEYEQNNNSADGLTRVFGFVAEELIEIGLTDYVDFNEDGSVQSIAYDRLTAALIPVLQHQQEKIESLEARLALLEEQAGTS
jgi:hypothetical protein